MSKKRIGFLGGTFDPIHFGHLNLAIEALEKKKLDEIWFCPTPLSPHKRDNPPISIEHRLKMVELATENEPRFRVIDIEARSSKNPYTYDTLVTLRDENPNNELILLLSEDLIPNLDSWHKVNKLLVEFDLFVGTRPGFKPFELSDLDEFVARSLEGRLTPIRGLEISSKSLRERLKNKLYCHHLMPGKVLDYISQNGLY